MTITRRLVAYSAGLIDALLCLALAALASVDLLFFRELAGGVGQSGNGFITLAPIALSVLFARAAWFAFRREWRPRWQAAPLVGTAALVAWLTVAANVRDRHVEDYDRRLIAAIAALQPRLPALAAALASSSGAAGITRCDSSMVPGFPMCIRDGQRILLLAAPSADADYLHPLEGLAYNPTGEPTEFIGGWYIGTLLEPLGAGWYHVRGYPGLD